MSQDLPAHWLLAYDIADPRRLAHVFKHLKKVGTPVQYSVFSLQASHRRMKRLMVELALMVDKREDDVRAYRIPERTWQVSLGDAILPDGILLG